MLGACNGAVTLQTKPVSKEGITHILPKYRAEQSNLFFYWNINKEAFEDEYSTDEYGFIYFG